MKKKILLIEDDIFLHKVYQSLLEKDGHTVKALNNGLDAVKTALEFKPDLILLDLIMPHKDGFDTLKDLRANPKTKNIPVNVISQLKSKEDIAKAEEIGINAYYIKSNHSFKDILKLVH